jgi:hypothetical protein
LARRRRREEEEGPAYMKKTKDPHPACEKYFKNT